MSWPSTHCVWISLLRGSTLSGYVQQDTDPVTAVLETGQSYLMASGSIYLDMIKAPVPSSCIEVVVPDGQCAVQWERGSLA